MNYYREKVQIVILVLLYCVAFIIQYLISQNINVWFDETYSMITANMTFSVERRIGSGADDTLIAAG